MNKTTDSIAILDTIPFKLDRQEIFLEFKIKEGSDSAHKIGKFLDTVEETARPKGIYREAYIQKRSEDSLVIAGETFTSAALQKNLTSVQRVFPYVATCGTEITDQVSIIDDFVMKSRAGMIKLKLLYIAVEYIKKEIRDRFRLNNLSTMNPGSGDASIWPMSEQKPLFSLLYGREKEIGVTLSPSLIMTPDMTTSGILFPSETSYDNCRLCHRERCPGRKAPFSQELWKEIYP